MRRHIVLIGLPGSGKTVVGRHVARLLSTQFVDVDTRIEEAEAQKVTEIFRERGEQVFRDLERSTVRALLRQDPCVIAPGGGWAAQPHTSADAADALVVYLETAPEEAARRVERCSGRPLLAGDNSEGRMLELWAARRVFYERAGHDVQTTGQTVAQVAESVVTLARSAGGW